MISSFKHSHSSACIAAVIAASLLLSVPALAQTTTPPGEETIVLSPFIVQSEKDVGYVANDTITGSRMRVNLLDAPGDVTVFTQEFLRDLGTFNLTEAYKWLPSSEVIEPTNNVDGGANTYVRGLLPSGNTRNYFAFAGTPEQYVTDRIEGSRGPNGIIYGNGNMSGQANVLTKRAEYRKFETVSVRADSEGSREILVDVNNRFSDKFSVRVLGSILDRRTWRDNYKDDRRGVYAALSYRPWKNTELRLSAELDYTKTQLLDPSFFDQRTSWDQTTVVTGPLSANLATATGITRQTADRLTIGILPGSIVNLNGFGITRGTNLGVAESQGLPNLTVLPRSGFSVQPPDANLNVHFRTFEASFEKVFANNLVVEIAAMDYEAKRNFFSAYWNNVYVDVNRNLPGGALNPRFGQLYSETNLTNIGSHDSAATLTRAAIAYPWETRWFNQTFSLIGEYRHSALTPEYYRFGRTNNATTPDVRATANLVYFRQYWDESTAGLVYPENGNGYEFGWVKSRDTDTEETGKSIQLTTMGFYLNRRLTVTAGIRRDESQRSVRNISTYDTRGVPNGYLTEQIDRTATTRSIGGVFFPVRPFGVYANYSEGFNPNSQNFPALTGRTVPASLSDGVGLGIRFRLWDSRVVGSLGYYSSKEVDNPIQVSSSQINQIWADLNKAERQLALGTYVDTQVFKAHGYEADITANVTKRFRLKFNFAIPRTTQTDGLPDTSAYFAANEAEWRAGAADASNPNATRIQNNIDTLRNTLLATADNRPRNRQYDYRANIFGVYEFGTGLLKGFRVGGGGRFYGAHIIGNVNNQPYNLIKDKSYATCNLTAGYGFKVRNKPVNLQLNVDNLLDYRDPIWDGTGVVSGVTYFSRYYFIEPLKVTVSANIKF